MSILDVGCGMHKLPGSIGVDIKPIPGVDVVFDLDRRPYPFQDNSFDRIKMTEVIEHVNCIRSVMEEVHRIIKPNGVLEITTPHYSSHGSYLDPMHKWHLSSESFLYFDQDVSINKFYTTANFKIEHNHVSLRNLGRFLGLEFLVNLCNRSPKFHFLRKLWERDFSLIIRGKSVSIKLRAKKEEVTGIET